MRKLLLVILLCFTFCAFAQKRMVNWHHNLSPYRALFSVDSGGNPLAGALLEVPICRTGPEDGSSVFCYSESGKQLASRYLGKGVQNCSLVQVMPDKDRGTIFAYFGSDQRAPVANFALPPALCRVYAIKGKAKNWQELSTNLVPFALLGQFPVDEFVRVGNPVDFRDEFAMVFSAKLSITHDGAKNLFVASDDAGYLFIDGNLIIARDGVHGVGDSLRGENRKFVEFKRGYHDVKLVGANYGKDFVVALGEWFPTKEVAHLPKAIYVQSARTTLLSIESHRKDATIPVFKYNHLADMPLGERHLTITEFETYDGGDVDWEFSDGVKLSGAKVRRAFGSMATMTVKVKAGQNYAGGYVMFPQLAPARVENAKKQRAFEEFDSLISKEMIVGSTADALYALMDFYSRRDLHPKQMLVAEAFLEKGGIQEDRKFDAYLMLARSAALYNPDKALKAYNHILQSPFLKRGQFADMLSEAFEFALFGMRDFDLAESMLRRYSQRRQYYRKMFVAMEFDLALQQGKMEEASRLYQELLNFRVDKTERRTAAVKGTSIQAKVSMFLSQGNVFAAENAMRDWIAISPQDRSNGSFSIERARCFRMRGWSKGAIGELTAAIQADPLLPNLPDVEFELALAYNDLGDKEKAQELFKKISKEYPNHRLAGEASKRLWK